MKWASVSVVRVLIIRHAFPTSHICVIVWTYISSWYYKEMCCFAALVLLCRLIYIPPMVLLVLWMERNAWLVLTRNGTALGFPRLLANTCFDCQSCAAELTIALPALHKSISWKCNTPPECKSTWKTADWEKCRLTWLINRIELVLCVLSLPKSIASHLCIRNAKQESIASHLCIRNAKHLADSRFSNDWAVLPSSSPLKVARGFEVRMCNAVLIFLYASGAPLSRGYRNVKTVIDRSAIRSGSIMTMGTFIVR